MQTQARAEAIAKEAMTAPAMGPFAIASLVEILVKLIPVLFSGCYTPTDGPRAKTYVVDNYDASQVARRYRGYTRNLYVGTWKSVARTARRRGKTMTDGQVTAATFALLDNLRTGDDEQLSLIIQEHHHVDRDDDIDWTL